MDKVSFTIYLAILILNPLLFGAVHTYAYTLLALGVLTASLLLVVKAIEKDPKSGTYHLQLPRTGLDFLFLALLAFLFFQIIPLPDFLLEFLSPEAKVVGQKSLLASVVSAPDSPIRTWFTLSPYRYPVLMSIIRWTVYGLFFFGLLRVLNSQKRIELTVRLILITGCFEALYGLAQTFSGAEHIWWFKKIAYRGDVTGTYINRNHFAGLMEMGLLLAAAYSTALTKRKKKEKTLLSRKSAFKGRLSRFLSQEQRFHKRTFFLFSGVVMGVGLFFSASRGGMLAAAGGMLCMSLLFVSRRGFRRRGFVLLFLFLITSAYALSIGVQYPLGRFKYFDSSFEARTRYAQKTMDMFKDYKLTGVGVGNFQYAYPKYQASKDKRAFIRHAHNDWAQFLAEAGILGSALFLAGIFFYPYGMIRLWKRRRDPFAICLGAAPLAAMTAVAIHSYSDFNLHIPANFLMLAAVMAIGYSALHLQRQGGGRRTLHRSRVISIKYKGIAVLLPVLVLIVWAGYWSIRHFMAEAYCNTVTNSTLNRDQRPPLEKIKKAISWDKGNARYWYKLAMELRRIRDADIRALILDLGFRKGVSRNPKDRQMEIIRALEESVRLNPYEAKYHIRLGEEYSRLWSEPDSDETWHTRADLSMDRAAYFCGQDIPYLHVMMGHYWIRRSKAIEPSDPKWKRALNKARRHYKKNLSLESRAVRKRRIKEIRENIWVHYPDEAFVIEVIE